jgi:type II restriction/modification system DNA methylase subunit YeeA
MNKKDHSNNEKKKNVTLPSQIGAMRRGAMSSRKNQKQERKGTIANAQEKTFQ